MSTALKRAYTGQLAATVATLYTCPANTTARVLKSTATNDTTTPDTVTFYLVPSGGTAGVTNLILNTKAIGNKETYECPEVVGQILEAGDTIQGLAGTADQITAALGVVEIV